MASNFMAAQESKFLSSNENLEQLAATTSKKVYEIAEELFGKEKADSLGFSQRRLIQQKVVDCLVAWSSRRMSTNRRLENLRSILSVGETCDGSGFTSAKLFLEREFDRDNYCLTKQKFIHELCGYIDPLTEGETFIIATFDGSIEEARLYLISDETRAMTLSNVLKTWCREPNGKSLASLDKVIETVKRVGFPDIANAIIEAENSHQQDTGFDIGPTAFSTFDLSKITPRAAAMMGEVNIALNNAEQRSIDNFTRGTHIIKDPATFRQQLIVDRKARDRHDIEHFNRECQNKARFDYQEAAAREMRAAKEAELREREHKRVQAKAQALAQAKAQEKAEEEKSKLIMKKYREKLEREEKEARAQRDRKEREERRAREERERTRFRRKERDEDQLIHDCNQQVASVCEEADRRLAIEQVRNAETKAAAEKAAKEIAQQKRVLREAEAIREFNARKQSEEQKRVSQRESERRREQEIQERNRQLRDEARRVQEENDHLMALRVQEDENRAAKAEEDRLREEKVQKERKEAEMRKKSVAELQSNLSDDFRRGILNAKYECLKTSFAECKQEGSVEGFKFNQSYRSPLRLMPSQYSDEEKRAYLEQPIGNERVAVVGPNKPPAKVFVVGTTEYNTDVYSIIHECLLYQECEMINTVHGSVNSVNMARTLICMDEADLVVFIVPLSHNERVASNYAIAASKYLDDTKPATIAVLGEPKYKVCHVAAPTTFVEEVIAKTDRVCPSKDINGPFESILKKYGHK